MANSTVLEPTPFFLEAGSTGVLLIHGFTGSPAEMRLVGEYLSQRGLTVCAPLLPGHGTKIDDLNRCCWSDWAEQVAVAMTHLQDHCQTVFVGGLSLGALLSLYLATELSSLAGVIVYSPAIKVTDRRRFLLPFIKHLIRQLPKPPDIFTDPTAHTRLWSYPAYPVAASHQVMKLIAHLTPLLPQITCAALIIHSTADPTIHPESAQFVYDRIGSTDKEIVTLHNSGHVLTLDGEWEQVAERSYQFMQQRVPAYS